MMLSLRGLGADQQENRVELEARYPPRLVFYNTTTGNTSRLYVGDSFALEIYGPPNSEVRSSGSGPGGVWDGTSHGYTDSQGVLRINGTMTAAEIGRWTQNWFVDDFHAGSVTFDVWPPTGADQQVWTDITSRQEVPELEPPPGWLARAQSNPWLLAGGAVVLLLLLGRGK